MNPNSLNRRQLCKAVVIGIPATLLLGSSVNAIAKAAAEAQKAPELKLVPESDPTAKALGYVADATKAKREKKGAVEGKDQNCTNCQLYTKQGEVGKQEAGKCLMIQNGAVLGAGWCKSWIKKP
ncbi:MAG: high-potential iron-sulfur protein [Oligoflexales bacterium]|nr:high-potential iron-sulfur protein [Oligoflexales bacterium]